MKAIKNWVSKKWQQLKKSRFLLGAVMLSIGISWTVSYYEFKVLWVDYQEALKTFERFENKEVGVVVSAVAHASTEQDVVNAIQEEEETAKASSTSPTAQLGNFSAYNAEVGQTDSDPFTMASGKKVFEGAVANNCLPFGTKVKVGEKIYEVQDRMNSRYDCDHFDIYMESYDDAIKFGRKQLSFIKLESEVTK